MPCLQGLIQRIIITALIKVDCIDDIILYTEVPMMGRWWPWWHQVLAIYSFVWFSSFTYELGCSFSFVFIIFYLQSVWVLVNLPSSVILSWFPLWSFFPAVDGPSSRVWCSALLALVLLWVLFSCVPQMFPLCSYLMCVFTSSVFLCSFSHCCHTCPHAVCSTFPP